jgi:hypothetical protein
MSGLWGHQTALDLYLKENGITTLLFGGVNADQVGMQLHFTSFLLAEVVLVRFRNLRGRLLPRL